MCPKKWKEKAWDEESEGFDNTVGELDRMEAGMIPCVLQVFEILDFYKEQWMQ